jgi:hypothetical protein
MLTERGKQGQRTHEAVFVFSSDRDETSRRPAFPVGATQFRSVQLTAPAWLSPRLHEHVPCS